MAAPTRTPRSTWIEAGLRALAAGGPDAVRIEPLAQVLGVTRGGFYWHFADRRALLDEMLDTWERTTIDEVIERIDREGGDAEAKLLRLAGLVSSGVVAVDLAVRDWARREQAVAERLEVEARCLLYYSLLIGNHFIAASHGARSRPDVTQVAIRRLAVPGGPALL